MTTDPNQPFYVVFTNDETSEPICFPDGVVTDKLEVLNDAVRDDKIPGVTGEFTQTETGLTFTFTDGTTVQSVLNASDSFASQLGLAGIDGYVGIVDPAGVSYYLGYCESADEQDTESDEETELDDDEHNV